MTVLARINVSPYKRILYTKSLYFQGCLCSTLNSFFFFIRLQMIVNFTLYLYFKYIFSNPFFIVFNTIDIRYLLIPKQNVLRLEITVICDWMTRIVKPTLDIVIELFATQHKIKTLFLKYYSIIWSIKVKLRLQIKYCFKTSSWKKKKWFQ